MKKILYSLMIIIVSATLLVGCKKDEVEITGINDLTGIWRQYNSNSEDTFQEAVIEDNTITINWVSDNGDTKSLYWAGSYDAPAEEVINYSWISNNDKEKTDMSLLASGDDTKEFIFENGEINWTAGMLGQTITVRTHKLEE